MSILHSYLRGHLITGSSSLSPELKLPAHTSFFSTPHLLITVCLRYMSQMDWLIHTLTILYEQILGSNPCNISFAMPFDHLNVSLFTIYPYPTCNKQPIPCTVIIARPAPPVNSGGCGVKTSKIELITSKPFHASLCDHLMFCEDKSWST